MGQIRENRLTIRRKSPDKPRKKLEFKRVTINNQVQRLRADASVKRKR